MSRALVFINTCELYMYINFVFFILDKWLNYFFLRVPLKVHCRPLNVHRRKTRILYSVHNNITEITYILRARKLFASFARQKLQTTVCQLVREQRRSTNWPRIPCCRWQWRIWTIIFFSMVDRTLLTLVIAWISSDRIIS